MPGAGGSGLRDRRVLVVAPLAVAFALFVLVGVAGPSSAKPPLGPRGWAPGELAWSPSPWLVTGLLWAAYLVGAAGVAVHLRSRPLAVSWWVPVGLGVAALLTGPFGSPDHTVYAAYGRIAAAGGDPWLVPPDGALAPGDPVLRFVDPPWQDTVSIYGPVATALQAVCALVGGDSMRQVVWCWQVLVVLAWLGVRWLLLRASVDRGRVDALWTLNPLVFALGVLGAHVDLVAAALAVASLVAATRVPWLAGLLTGLAASTKVTYAVVALAVPVAWWTTREAGRLGRRLAAFAGSAVAVTVLAHWWAGPHVLDQLARARRAVSLAMPWRLLFEALAGPMRVSTARAVVGVGAVLLFALFVLLLARLTRDVVPDGVLGTAARWTFVLAGAYAFAAPYSLPWYDLLLWATLPVLSASVLDRVALARLALVGVAYVPGRVAGVPADVWDVTLWVRRRLAPVVHLAVWGWLTTAAWRASSRPPAPRPPGPGPRRR